jgi:hypothetical protein
MKANALNSIYQAAYTSPFPSNCSGTFSKFQPSLRGQIRATGSKRLTEKESSNHDTEKRFSIYSNLRENLTKPDIPDKENFQNSSILVSNIPSFKIADSMAVETNKSSKIDQKSMNIRMDILNTQERKLQAQLMNMNKELSKKKARINGFQVNRSAIVKKNILVQTLTNEQNLKVSERQTVHNRRNSCTYNRVDNRKKVPSMSKTEYVSHIAATTKSRKERSINLKSNKEPVIQKLDKTLKNEENEKRKVSKSILIVQPRDTFKRRKSLSYKEKYLKQSSIGLSDKSKHLTQRNSSFSNRKPNSLPEEQKTQVKFYRESKPSHREALCSQHEHLSLANTKPLVSNDPKGKLSFYENAKLLRESKLIVCSERRVQIYDLNQLNLDLKMFI